MLRNLRRRDLPRSCSGSGSTARATASSPAIAGKAVKEARYHREHAADWVVRLGDGTAESAARLKAALDLLWPYFAEIFEADAVDDRGRRGAPRPALGRPARRLARRLRRRARGRRPVAAGRARVPQHRQDRPPQRAPRLRAGRDAASAALVSGRRVVMIDAAFGTPLPAPPLRAAGSSRIEHAWAVLATVLDPEVPVVSVVDLGIVREVIDDGDALIVVVTPTYSGCPATEVIEASIVAALDDAGLGPTRIRMQRAPAWTSDWISAEGRAKLRGYGIVPPGSGRSRQGRAASLRAARRRRRSPARAARARTPSAWPRSARPRARRSGAAAPAASRSSTSSRSRRAVALHFHPLRVKSVRPETDEAVVVSFDVPGRARRAVPLHPGPAPDAEGDDRRQRAAPLVLDLRRPVGRRAARRHPQGAGRRVLDLAQRDRSRPATRCR